ncbi:MAG: hypothetical protein KJ018_13465 [Burkholderiales bacterium]|nr:hypothetical protein [Burkholderiales bacterium]GIK88095.1 MAG: hypothetical protein BroJett026_35760 [Betaproteobacteria bacterium]
MNREPTTNAWVRFHPLTRIVVVVASVLSLVLFAGVERVGEALAHFSPGGSFEARCDDLPPSEVTVRVVPPRVLENRSTPAEALTRLGEGAAPGERTIGLTLANFGHSSTFEMRGVEDRRGGRACVRPAVSVHLYLKPLTVYVASEYSGDPCRARVIREHEERHVAVYTEFAGEAASRLRASLAKAIGTSPHFAADVGEAQGNIDRRLGATLEAFMRDAQRELAQRQALIDTPEEYERVRTACLAPA